MKERTGIHGFFLSKSLTLVLLFIPPSLVPFFPSFLPFLLSFYLFFPFFLSFLFFLPPSLFLSFLPTSFLPFFLPPVALHIILLCMYVIKALSDTPSQGIILTFPETMESASGQPPWSCGRKDTGSDITSAWPVHRRPVKSPYGWDGWTSPGGSVEVPETPLWSGHCCGRVSSG